MSELIDNRSHRISVLKQIIQHLHAGADPALVKERLRKIVGETDATEIMAMEQQLMAEGMLVKEVRSMCDLHSQVTRDVLVQLPSPSSIPPGHPIDAFLRENAALRTSDRYPAWNVRRTCQPLTNRPTLGKLSSGCANPPTI